MPYSTFTDAPENDLSDNPHAEELYRLGLMYSTGLGVQVDLIAAHKWFNLSVQAGMDDARASRASIAEQMTSSDIRAAQRAAREWPAHRAIAC